MKKIEADIPCSKCGRNFRQRIEDMIPGRTRSCPFCSVEIRFTGDDGRKAQRALDDLERTVRRLGRR